MVRGLDSPKGGEFGCCVAAVDNDVRKESLRGMIYFLRVLCQGGRLFNCGNLTLNCSFPLSFQNCLCLQRESLASVSIHFKE